jgi:hypothetical protein
MGGHGEKAWPKPGSFAADATAPHHRLKPCKLVINKLLVELIGKNTTHRYFSGRKLGDHAIERSNYLLVRLLNVTAPRCFQFRLPPSVASSAWNYTGAIGANSVESEFGQAATLVAWEIDGRAPRHSSGAYR